MSKSETLEGTIETVEMQISGCYASISVAVLSSGTSGESIEIAKYCGLSDTMGALYQVLRKHIGKKVAIEKDTSFFGSGKYEYPVFIKEATKNEP